MTEALPPSFDDSSPRDEEGLRLHYDVIIVGTGLIQSILASALARAGKSVLHCDANDYYGELDAVYTLPYLENLADHLNKEHILSKIQREGIGISSKGSLRTLKVHSMQRHTDFDLRKGSTVSTRYGMGTILDMTVDFTKRDYTSIKISLDAWKLTFGNSPIIHVGLPKHLFSMENDTSIEEYLAKTQQIISREKVLAEEILTSHSRSFAIDLTPSCIYASGPAVSGLLKSGVADYLEFKSLEGLYWLGDTLEQVPCSKNDVFKSSLLSPMDKRRLMKFLQLALDYGTAKQVHEETFEDIAVQSLNERHLNQGRSLARPQNKAVMAEDIHDLEQCCAEQMDFETFLKTKQRLSDKLTALTRYALALERERWNVREGMDSLCQHMKALGRYGNTAFLVPMYGSGEMSQAFCRSAAVYGATYLLRRPVVDIVTPEGTVQNVQLVNDNGTAVKTISCNHVICPAEALAAPPSDRRVLRRLGIVMGKVISNTRHEQRHVIILPPNRIGNTEPIHGLLLDETVNIAPHVSGGCSIVHLTTVVEGNDPDLSVLDKAMELLLQYGQKPKEIFSTTLSYYLSREDVQPPEGMRIVQRGIPGLSLDEAFEQAHDIFTSICADLDFLATSSAVDQVIKERVGDSQTEDDEQLLLESAVSMLNKTSNPGDHPERTLSDD